MKFKFKNKNELLLDEEKSPRINYRSSRERYLKKNRTELIVFSSIIIIILLGIIFLNTSFFSIKTINLNGSLQVEKSKVEASIDSNAKIWQIDTENLADTIKSSSPLIKEISITKDYFNTLNVDIVEKRIVAQEKNSEGTYVKLLENSEVYAGDLSVQESVPVLENFLEQEELKKEVLKNLTELNSEVLNRTSEIILDEGGMTITIYMKDGQKIKADPKSFSEKLNYYLKIEQLIEDKSDSVLNIVNGVYLETENSNRIKEDRIKQIIQESNGKPEETTETVLKSNQKNNGE